MRWRGQVLHLLRKDLLRHWPLLAGLVTVCGAFAVSGGMGPGLPGRLLGPLLVPSAILVLGALVVASAVQDDPLRGPDARWRSLPVRRSAVVGAKAALVGLLALVVVAGTAFPWTVTHGVKGSAMAGILAASLGWSLGTFVLAAALALITPTLGSFLVLGLVVTAVGTAAEGGWTALRAPAPPSPIPAPEALRAGPLQLAHVPGLRRLPSRTLPLPLTLTHPAPGAGYLFHPEALEIHPAQGSPVLLHLRESAWPLHTPPLPSGDDATWLGAPAPSPDAVRFQVPLGEGAWVAASFPGVRFVLRGRLEVLVPEPLGSLSAAGGRLRARGVRVEADGSAVGEAPLRVPLHRSSVRTGPTASTAHEGRGHVQRGALAFALLHPERGEAMAVVEQIRSRRGVSRVLGGGEVVAGLLLPLQDRGRDQGQASLPVGLRERAGGPAPGWLNGAWIGTFRWRSVGSYPVQLRWVDDGTPENEDGQ